MSRNELSESELQALKKFRFTVDYQEDNPAIQYLALLDRQHIRAHLETLSEKVGAPNLRVMASLLMKRVAFFAVIHLYAMTVFGKRLEGNSKHIHLLENNKADLWLPYFYFGPLNVEVIDKERSKDRSEIIHQVFSKCLDPLIQQLAKEVKLPVRVMWENIALYVFWLYEVVVDAENSSNAIEDYQYIIHEAPGELFGNYKKNPLSQFASDKINIAESNEWIRIRKTCCFSYLMEGSGKKMCATCPINGKNQQQRCR